MHAESDPDSIHKNHILEDKRVNPVYSSSCTDREAHGNATLRKLASAVDQLDLETQGTI